MSFSDNLSKRRKKCGISQDALANEANVSLRMYQNYEKGTHVPTITVAQKLAEALDIDLDTLLSDKKTSRKTIVTTQTIALAEARDLAKTIKYEKMDEDTVIDIIKMINDAFYHRTKSYRYIVPKEPTEKYVEKRQNKNKKK